VMKVFRV